jgi:hypothetical protein
VLIFRPDDGTGGFTMTEWTLDMIIGLAEPADVASVEVDAAPTDTPYADLVTDALLDDLELDRGDWLT